MNCREEVNPARFEDEYCAAHRAIAGVGLKVCNSAAGSAFANLTHSFVELFLTGRRRHGG
jgi:hypothetical protein